MSPVKYLEIIRSIVNVNADRIKHYNSRMIIGYVLKVFVPAFLYLSWWAAIYETPEFLNKFLGSWFTFLALLIWCTWSFVRHPMEVLMSVDIPTTTVSKLWPYLFTGGGMDATQISRLIREKGLLYVQFMEERKKTPITNAKKAKEQPKQAKQQEKKETTVVVDHPLNQLFNNVGSGKYNIHLFILAIFLAVMAVINNLRSVTMWLLIGSLGIVWLSARLFYKGPKFVKHNLAKAGTVAIATVLLVVILPLVAFSSAESAQGETQSEPAIEEEAKVSIERMALEPETFVLPGTIINPETFGAGIGEVESITIGVNSYTDLLLEILTRVESSQEPLADLSPYIEGVGGQGGLNQATADITCWTTGGCNLSDGTYLEESFETRVDNTELSDEEKRRLLEPQTYIKEYWDGLLNVTDKLQNIGLMCEGKHECTEKEAPGVAELWRVALQAQTDMVNAAVRYNTWLALNEGSVELALPVKIVEGFFSTSQRIPAPLRMTATPQPTVPKADPMTLAPTFTPTPESTATQALPTATLLPPTWTSVPPTWTSIPPTITNTPIAAYNLGNPQNLVAWMAEENSTTLSNSSGCGGVNAGTAQLMYTENNTPVFVQLIGYAQWHASQAGCEIKMVRGRQQGDFWHTITTNGVELSIYPFPNPADNPTYPGQTRNDAIPLSQLRAAMDANGWTYLYLDPACSNDTHNARMYIHLDGTILAMETSTGTPDYVFVLMEGGIGQHYYLWNDRTTLCQDKPPMYISTFQGAEWPWRNAYNLWFLPFDP